MALTQKLMFEASGKSCLIFLLSLLVCTAAAPYEDTSSLEDMSSSLQDVSKRGSSFDNNNNNYNPFLSLFNSNGQLEDKRALSLFAHWKPRYGYKGDFPAINTRSDIVTRGGSSSHARPLGQPLRWG